MAQSTLSKLNLSKQRLNQLQESLQEKGEEVRQESARLRDVSLTRLYEAGANTLSKAAQWLDKLPGAQDGAEQLREAAQASEQAGAAVQRPPIADYDELNVRQVEDALEGLSAYELEKVRRYEEANKDRVTVYRAIDRQLG